MTNQTITADLLNDLRAQISAATQSGVSAYDTVLADQPVAVRAILWEAGDAEFVKASESKVGDVAAWRVTAEGRWSGRETFYVTEDGYVVTRYSGAYGTGLRWMVSKTGVVEAYAVARWGTRSIDGGFKASNLSEIAESIAHLRDFEATGNTQH